VNDTQTSMLTLFIIVTQQSIKDASSSSTTESLQEEDLIYMEILYQGALKKEAEVKATNVPVGSKRKLARMTFSSEDELDLNGNIVRKNENTAKRIKSRGVEVTRATVFVGFKRTLASVNASYEDKIELDGTVSRSNEPPAKRLLVEEYQAVVQQQFEQSIEEGSSQNDQHVPAIVDEVNLEQESWMDLSTEQAAQLDTSSNCNIEVNSAAPFVEQWISLPQAQEYRSISQEIDISEEQDEEMHDAIASSNRFAPEVQRQEDDSEMVDNKNDSDDLPDYEDTEMIDYVQDHSGTDHRLEEGENSAEIVLDPSSVEQSIQQSILIEEKEDYALEHLRRFQESAVSHILDDTYDDVPDLPAPDVSGINSMVEYGAVSDHRGSVQVQALLNSLDDLLTSIAVDNTLTTSINQMNLVNQ
jgi:DNA-nicking Smr family endonuclease